MTVTDSDGDGHVSESGPRCLLETRVSSSGAHTEIMKRYGDKAHMDLKKQKTIEERIRSVNESRDHCTLFEL